MASQNYYFLSGHSWTEDYDIKKEAKLVKHVSNPIEFTVWETFLSKMKEKLIFIYHQEKNLITKYIRPLLDDSEEWLE